MTRINRAIELLEQGQPVYYIGPEYFGFEGGVVDYTYEEGVRLSQSWSDIVLVLMEHDPLDITRLRDFMRGMVDGGPTRSGHRTPTVIVEMPFAGTDEHVILANSWIVNQVLATGVHGMLLCHADTPEAVRSFVEVTRYPFQTIGVGDKLNEGRRGSGGQLGASGIWGISPQEYLQRADIWPLNPNGELLLGIKIENKRGLSRTEDNLSVPGISFVEWAPLDMSLSLNQLGGNLPPYPPAMEASRQRVLKSCRDNNVFYTGQVFEDNVTTFIDEGLMVGVPLKENVAEMGRQHTGRTMPW